MNYRRGYYSLVQCCPNPSRAESANVGVVLFCPEAGFLQARMATGNDRVRRLFRGEGLDLGSLNSAKRSLARRLEVDQKAIRSLEDLQQFVDSRANVLKLTAPPPVKVLDPEADLEQLFVELVGGRVLRAQHRPDVPVLDNLFRRLEQQGRARLDWTIQIPVLRRGLKIPYAYRNGVWNLVKPQQFPGQEDPALRTAMKLALEGDLLRRHATEEDGEKHLIVVTAFGGRSQPEIERRVFELLSAYEVQTVREEQIDLFAQQIEQIAHTPELH